MAGPKPMWTEFGIYHILESCEEFLWLLFQIFKCPSCPQIWGGEGLMKTHKLSHVKPTLAFKCLGCKNIFSSKPAIASHKCPAKSQPKGPAQTPDILQKAVNSINGTKGQPLPTASTTGIIININM